MSYPDPTRSGPPTWLIVVIAGTLVVSGYLIWNGVRSYLASGMRGIVEATEVAIDTATANAPPTRDLRFTPPPTRTPVPPCQEFRVTVPEAIIRECASTRCPIKGVLHEGDPVCVLERDYEQPDWYIVDLEPEGFLLDLAYMHQDIIRAVNPTPTPPPTPFLPTVTPLPSDTPLPTPRPSPTPGTPTPPTDTPTFTPSPTPPLISG